MYYLNIDKTDFDIFFGSSKYIGKTEKPKY